VFKPYSGVCTAALILARPLDPAAGQRDRVRGEVRETATKFVWFYDLTADGYSLDDKRTPIETNDILDLLAKWPNREEGQNSYRVPIEKIKENDWSLAAGRYKAVITETVKHDNPKDILDDVLKLESNIIRRSNALMNSLASLSGEGKGEGWKRSAKR
jgi:type I restriction enzyme M protein